MKILLVIISIIGGGCLLAAVSYLLMQEYEISENYFAAAIISGLVLWLIKLTAAFRKYKLDKTFTTLK